MTKTILKILTITLLIIGCQKDQKQDPFKISTNRIGLLTSEMNVQQLDSIFATDSITKTTNGGQFLKNSKEIEIYEKGGAKLLILEPNDQTDPLSKITTIQIIDARYKTSSGLSINSTFKDVTDHYKISKINNTLSTAVVFIDSIQAYFTIDKKELSQKFQSTTDIEIMATDIPDSSKIKHFWINWSVPK